jgi:hypothetical protein
MQKKRTLQTDIDPAGPPPMTAILFSGCGWGFRTWGIYGGTRRGLRRSRQSASELRVLRRSSRIFSYSSG